jgi:hypothetical protein
MNRLPGGTRGMGGGMRGAGGSDSIQFEKRNFADEQAAVRFRFLDSARYRSIDSSISDYFTKVPMDPEYINLGNNGSIISTTQYLEVVLKLEVVPLINADGEVSLTISQINDTLVGTQLIQPNLVPIIGTEQLVTSVTIPDRNTIVLGGLISEEKNLNKSGIPFLSSIPGVGKLFRTDTNTTTRKELIVFIQPQVVADSPALQHTSLSEDLRTESGAAVAQRFPQHVEAPKALPIEEAPLKKKNFFQRMFSRDPKPKAQP